MGIKQAIKVNGPQFEGGESSWSFNLLFLCQPKVNLIYISIATSNYSQCYVVADVRNPTMIYVVFRGPYSAKSAGAFMLPKYLKLATIVAKENIQVAAGIYKLMIEMAHIS